MTGRSVRGTDKAIVSEPRAVLVQSLGSWLPRECGQRGFGGEAGAPWGDTGDASGLPGSLLFRGDGDRMDPSRTMRAWPFWSLPHAGAPH